MTSEIDAHVRFVHRTVTEFLASGEIVSRWRSNQLDLTQRLSSRRWDNTIVWALEELNDEGASSLVHSVYEIDPVLAYRMVASAELGTVRVWLAFLGALQKAPPPDDTALRMIHSVDGVKAPSAAAPALKQLMYLPEHLGGWAASLFAPHAGDEELRHWIDRLDKGEIDFNYATISGSSLGSRLSGTLLEYFLATLQNTQLDSSPTPDGSDHVFEMKRHAFASVMLALSLEDFRSVLQWSNNQSADVRNVMCEAAQPIADSQVDAYLLKQLDRGLWHACFTIYLRLMYPSPDKPRPEIPRFTKKRLGKLIGAAFGLDAERARWSMALLREIATRDPHWANGVRSASKSCSDASMRRVLKTLHPGASRSAKEKFIYRALHNPKSLTRADRSLVGELANDLLEIDENVVLASISAHGRESATIIEHYFFPYHNTIIFTDRRVDDWVRLLSTVFPPGSRNDTLLWHICNHIARFASDKARDRLIALANDPDEISSDLVLDRIIPHMHAISTDDLTPSAGRRLINLYLDSNGPDFDSPGAITTERFVAQEILPLRESIGDNVDQRKRLEKLLMDAGYRHDRRYLSS